MGKSHRVFLIIISMSLCLKLTGCMMYSLDYSKNKLLLQGYEVTVLGIIPIGTNYVNMNLSPLEYDFYIRFPDDKVYHSSDLKVETFKNLDGVNILNIKGDLLYSYYPLPGGLAANPTTISILSTDNGISLHCFAEHHCSSPKRFYFAAAKDKDAFYSMPITHEQAVKIFGEPDKLTSRLSWFGD